MYGLLKKPISINDWVLGSKSPVSKVVWNKKADWTSFLPAYEHQRFGATETMACVSYSALNTIEILYNHAYIREVNFSDRFLAKRSGTTRRGNYLQTVAETIRKFGVCYEEDYPSPGNGFSWDIYYQDIPDQTETLAWSMGQKYQFKHEWVAREDFREALKYSPIQITVNAWHENDGVYHNPDNSQNHAVTLIRYDGDNPVIFDSYEPKIKTLSADHVLGSYGKQFTFIGLYKNNMEIKDNWLYQLVEAPGGLAMGLDGHLVLDDPSKLLWAHIQRNKGDIKGKQSELTKEVWDSIPKMNLKKEKL